MSGTRLKARYVVGEDGSRERTDPPDWLDTETDWPCRFKKASAPYAEVRCIPADGNVGYYFADAACTQALGFTKKGGMPPGAQMASSYDANGDPISVGYKLGAAVPIPGTLYEWEPGPTCKVSQTVIGADFDAYSYDPVDPSFFVLGTVISE